MAKNLQISAVILAGGRATRLGGVDKGLQPLHGKPLVCHIVERLQPQVSPILLNINRSFDAYRAIFPDFLIYSDELTDFQGALSGMLSGFHQTDSDYLLFVPCDSPFLPLNLVQKLATTLRINQAQISYAHDGERPHPTFALVHRSVVPALTDYLHAGERRLFHFFQTQKSVAVDFSEQPESFRNLNTPEEFISTLHHIPLPRLRGRDRVGGEYSPHSNVSAQSQPSHSPLPTPPPQAGEGMCAPLLAITGYSGTGKTTLLEKLIPALKKRGVKVGLIKHSHHNVDVDTAGKDSHRLRMAGANPTMVVCDQRWALMVETEQAVGFEQLITKMAGENVDLILLEGFKHEGVPKIQLHRKAVEKPLPELDEFTLATATDYPLARENLLDINNVEQIAEFIYVWLDAFSGKKTHQQ